MLLETLLMRTHHFVSKRYTSMRRAGRRRRIRRHGGAAVESRGVRLRGDSAGLKHDVAMADVFLSRVVETHENRGATQIVQRPRDLRFSSSTSAAESVAAGCMSLSSERRRRPWIEQVSRWRRGVEAMEHVQAAFMAVSWASDC